MDIISFGLASKVNKAIKDLIGDSKLTIPSGTTDDRPVLLAGDKAVRFNTDTNGLEEWNGTEWKNVSAPISAVRIKGTDTAANISAMVGMVAEDLWIASDTLDGYVYDGSEWINIGPLKGDTGTTGSQGIQGEAGNGISGISKTATVDDVDTYTIVMDDLTEYTFDVTNGTTIDHVSRTAGTGLSGSTDTYTMWLDIGETIAAGTFNVYNGVDGLGVGDMAKATYDTNDSGVVDNAEKVNGLTVETAVPANAVFTDTVYDDSTTTKQGNSFNGVSQLVKTDASGKLPAIDGSLLTGIGSGIGSFIDTSIAISSDGSALANDDGTANYNIGIGIGALSTVTTGRNNIGIGIQALKSTTTSKYNVGIGTDACKSNTTGDGNIGHGFQALAYTTTSNNNTAIGYRAGYGIRGAYNTAIGAESLQGAFNNLTGSYNTGIGYQTGYNLTTGQYNVLNGYQAGYSLTSESYEVAIGFKALYSKNGSGFDGSIAIGASAGQNITTGTGNVSVGRLSGYNVTSGSFNTMLGQEAGRYTGDEVGTYNSTYGIAIGYRSYLSGPNEMSLGNSAYITSAYTAVAFATRSDERQKDFYDMDLGLDFVTSITPRKYKWKEDAEASDKDSYFYGFSAQEVKANLPTDDKYGMHRTQGDSEDGVQNLTYTEMIAPLYKAIQEQQEMIKSMQDEINKLKGV